MDDPYCLVLPASHPLATIRAPMRLRESAHAHFVSFSRYQQADYFDRTAALCLESGFTPDIRHEAGQCVNVLALVACGLGVAIVPASFVTLPLGNVVFRRLERSHYKSQLVILRASHPLQDEWSTQLSAMAVAELRSPAERLNIGLAAGQQ